MHMVVDEHKPFGYVSPTTNDFKNIESTRWCYSGLTVEMFGLNEGIALSEI